MHIRPATAEDGLDVYSLARSFQSIASSFTEFDTTFCALLDSRDHRVWVAECRGTVVGWLHAFIALRVAISPFVEIGGLVVKEDYRRSGVGSALVHESAEWARSEGMALRVRCHSEREETHGFYQDFGFKVIKQQLVFELNR